MGSKKLNCKANFDKGLASSLLSAAFYHHGKLVSRYCKSFIAISLCVVIVCGLGMIQMEINDEIEYLFVPEGSQGEAEKALAQRYFIDHTERTEFIPNRLISTPTSRGQLIITNKNGSNVLQDDTMSKILRLDSMIRNISVTGNDSAEYQFEDLCMKWLGNCLSNPVIDIYRGFRSVGLKMTLTYPAHTMGGNHQILIASQLGNVKLFPNSSVVQSADAIILLYQLNGLPLYESLAAKWEKVFEDLVESFSTAEGSVLSIQYVTSDSLATEVNRATRSVLPRFIATFTMIILFAVFSLMSTDWVASKPYLALAGVLSAGFAITSSFGFLCFCGLPFNEIVAMMPFLVIGVGVDNMFIMVAAWRQLDLYLPVDERLGKSFSEAAVSITITNLTDILAFIVGASTPLPGMRVFCIYAGVSMCFAYFYQITFFAGCMALSGYREKQNRHCLTFCIVRPKEYSKNPYKLFCAGGVLDDGELHGERYVSILLLRLFRDYYGPAVTKWPVKFFAIVSFLGLITGAIIGIGELQEGLRLQNLAPDYSPPWQFYKSRDNFLSSFSPPVTLIFPDQIPYWEQGTQKVIENITKTYENSEFVHDEAGTSSWIRAYTNYLKEKFGTTVLPRYEFVDQLRYFLRDPRFKQFGLDMVIDDDTSDIVASRVIISTQNIHDGYGERDMMLEMRRLADSAPLNMSVFSPLFPAFDQYVNIIPYTLQTLGLAMLCMFCVALILIPHPICAIFVTLCAVSIDTAVLGFMSLWDVSLDILSMINIVLCIGFSVDFSAHITYAFVVAEEKDSSKRSLWALRSFGMPILQGALSTLIAIFPLQSAPVYIFRTFFKTLFLVMLFGALHGLLFLPVLLSLCGRFIKTSSGRHRTPEEKEQTYEVFFVKDDPSPEVVDRMITTL